MAGLSMTVANQGTNQVALAARISAVETKVEANKEAGAVKTDGINDRLTRMEAQLSFLVTTSKGQK